MKTTFPSHACTLGLTSHRALAYVMWAEMIHLLLSLAPRFSWKIHIPSLSLYLPTGKASNTGLQGSRRNRGATKQKQLRNRKSPLGRTAESLKHHFVNDLSGELPKHTLIPPCDPHSCLKKLNETLLLNSDIAMSES